MERITVKETSIKKGENDKGEWVNTRVTGTDGQKWGGFDKSLQYLKEGDVIEITEMEIKGQNKNILKWRKVEDAGTQAKPGNGSYSKTPDQFNIERRSYEAQTAFKGIVELLNGAHSELVPDDVRKGAFDWAKGRLTGTAPKQAEASKTEQKSTSTQEAMENGHFENAGQFAAAAFQEKGLNTTALCNKFGVKAVKDIADLDAAWEDLVAGV